MKSQKEVRKQEKQINQKHLIKKSLSFLLDLPNSLDFLYKEQFLEQMTQLAKKIIQKFYEMELQQSQPAFLKHLTFIFQSVCEQLYIQEQKWYQGIDMEQIHQIKKSQDLGLHCYNLNSGMYDQLKDNQERLTFSQDNNAHDYPIQESNEVIYNDQNGDSKAKTGLTQRKNDSSRHSRKMAFSSRNSPINSSRNDNVQQEFRQILMVNKQKQKTNHQINSDFIEINTPIIFGTSPRFKKLREKSPGPSDYKIESAQNIIKSANPKAVIPTQKRLLLQTKNSAPGPGEYNPTFRYTSK